jgi:hypothetical protein
LPENSTGEVVANIIQRQLGRLSAFALRLVTAALRVKRGVTAAKSAMLEHTA